MLKINGVLINPNGLVLTTLRGVCLLLQYLISTARHVTVVMNPDSDHHQRRCRAAATWTLIAADGQAPWANGVADGGARGLALGPRALLRSRRFFSLISKITGK